jgi:SIR2-like domain
MDPKEIMQLAQRVVHSRRKVVFLVGSALTSPEVEIQGRGVPGVDEMVDLIRKELPSGAIAERLRSDLARASNPYQTAFECLARFGSQDACNRLIQKAVLKCRKIKLRKSRPTEDDLRILEEDVEGWHVPRGARALGAILAKYRKELDCKVLTTNFDPLIEIAIRGEGGDYFSTTLHSDGNLYSVHGSVPQIVHLHGYWRGTDTLHTPTQLTNARPMLERSLRRMLDESMLVIVGYGGWNDVFMRALVATLQDEHGKPDIAWAFFEKDLAQVASRRPDLVASLKPFLGGRVHPFFDVEAHTFFLLLGAALQEQRRDANREGDLFNRMAEVYIKGWLGDTNSIPEFEEIVYGPDSGITREKFDFSIHVCEQLGASKELIQSLGGSIKGSIDRRVRIVRETLELKSAAEAHIGVDWCKPEDGDSRIEQLLREQVLSLGSKKKPKRTNPK